MPVLIISESLAINLFLTVPCRRKLLQGTDLTLVILVNEKALFTNVMTTAVSQPAIVDGISFTLMYRWFFINLIDSLLYTPYY